MDRYQLIKLAREDYTRWQELPPGYSFMEEVDRDGERELLQSEFPHWEIPFDRRLPGLTERGVLCVQYEGSVVGLAYACTENELGIEHYGQIHYAAVVPEHRGHRLLAAMVTEMFRRFPEHEGGIFYIDRDGHQPMYERWGGHLKGERPKAPTRRRRGIRGTLGAVRRRLAR